MHSYNSPVGFVVCISEHHNKFVMEELNTLSVETPKRHLYHLETHNV